MHLHLDYLNFTELVLPSKNFVCYKLKIHGYAERNCDP